MREFHKISNDPYFVKELTKKIKLTGEHYYINKVENNSFSHIV